MCRKFTLIFTTNFVGSLDIRASREVFPIEVRSPEISKLLFFRLKKPEKLWIKDVLLLLRFLLSADIRSVPKKYVKSNHCFIKVKLETMRCYVFSTCHHPDRI
jgi:hypothetical protein